MENTIKYLRENFEKYDNLFFDLQSKALELEKKIDSLKIQKTSYDSGMKRALERREEYKKLLDDVENSAFNN